MSGKITLDDLKRIFGEAIFPEEIDKKIIMKHFEVRENRIIGQKTVEKIKQVLLQAIDAARIEQFKEKGRVIENPDIRLSAKIKANEDLLKEASETSTQDKYGLESIQSGIVSKRLKKQNSTEKDQQKEKTKQKTTLKEKEESLLPSVEDLTVLSGGKLQREDIENNNKTGYVKREIAIRNYNIKDESQSLRWGKEQIIDRKGKNREINHPAYIFHSDLWQIEAARESKVENQCDILQHVVLDMIANNINVVMLENEEEPFFVVEGHGYLYSKDSLKDKVQIDELIQLMIITCDAWQIALKRPEALLRGQDTLGKEKNHQIDMTSVVPLSDIRTKFVQIDSEFKANYHHPSVIVSKAIRELCNHRKNIIWSCGANVIDHLRKAVKKHRTMIDSPKFELNVVIVGATHSFHPFKIKYNPDGEITSRELLPNYCSKHTILSENSIRNIIGSIPAIFDSLKESKSELTKIIHTVYQRLGYSAIETQFDPGYIAGNPSETFPISNLDIVLPPNDLKMQQKLKMKGFEVE